MKKAQQYKDIEYSERNDNTEKWLVIKSPARKELYE